MWTTILNFMRIIYFKLVERLREAILLIFVSIKLFISTAIINVKNNLKKVSNNEKTDYEAKKITSKYF